VSFVTALALGVALLVAAPWLAHRLRRKRADERPFAAAHLVPPAPPRARRRSALEDRTLFVVRALAVVALALLGASPLVRCQRLSVQRSGGASVAMVLVLDDSMSMRAKHGGETRFARARRGARELLSSAREGDAVAVVMAGAPPRVALAATTDLSTARELIDAVAESDRATDLEGALAMASGLVAQLPQVDRRVVLLSDLADGAPDGPPLGEGAAVPVWFATPELAGAAADCGVVRADRAGTRVQVKLRCTRGASAAGRELIAVTADGKDRVLARAPAPGGEQADATLTLPADEAIDLTVRLAAGDAIVADDAAPVVLETGPGAVAVVADTQSESAATGGAPVVEQALAALRLDVAVRPIPQVPDRAEDLTPFVGVILDDPPGLTPEQRRAIAAFLDARGAVLLALGPRAAAAPLGASLEPVLERAVAWRETNVVNADASKVSGGLAEGAASLSDLAPRGRAVLAPEDVAALEVLVPWADGPPLVARRLVARGEAWVTTLPFALDASDFTLRPGFLAILDGWLSEARQRAAPRRTDAGGAWLFPGAKTVVIEGPAGSVPTVADPAPPRATPPLLGRYRVTVDGKEEGRVAAPPVREIDLRPRGVATSAQAAGAFATRASVDVSWMVALALLGLTAVELALRAARVRATRAAAAAAAAAQA